jgi:hypothetical protein
VLGSLPLSGLFLIPEAKERGFISVESINLAGAGSLSFSLWCMYFAYMYNYTLIVFSCGNGAAGLEIGWCALSRCERIKIKQQRKKRRVKESSFYWPASLLSFSLPFGSLFLWWSIARAFSAHRNCKGALRRCPPTPRSDAERERGKRVEKEILIVYKRFPRLEFLPDCTLS